MIVAEGGELSGDVRQLDGAADLLRPSSESDIDSRPGSGDQARDLLELGGRFLTERADADCGRHFGGFTSIAMDEYHALGSAMSASASGLATLRPLRATTS